MYKRLKWAEVKYSGVPFLIGSYRAIEPPAVEPRAESLPQPATSRPRPEMIRAAPEESR